MDEFEKRLKQDAACIDASISPELEERLKASVHSIGRELPGRQPRSTTGGLWWASSLTGLAAAALILVLFNWNRAETSVEVPASIAGNTVPDYREYMDQLQDRLPLNTETADFAQGLEEELIRLQSDLEKAREKVSRDMDFTF